MKLLDLIDLMKQEMSEADLSDEQILVLTGAIGITITLSVGYVAWLLRVGYLATSLLTLTPMFIRDYDPLLVLAKQPREKYKDDNTDHDQGRGNHEALDRLFDENTHRKTGHQRLPEPS
jgi:hypothetical protein